MLRRGKQDKTTAAADRAECTAGVTTLCHHGRFQLRVILSLLMWQYASLVRSEPVVFTATFDDIAETRLAVPKEWARACHPYLELDIDGRDGRIVNAFLSDSDPVFWTFDESDDVEEPMISIRINVTALGGDAVFDVHLNFLKREMTYEENSDGSDCDDSEGRNTSKSPTHVGKGDNQTSQEPATHSDVSPDRGTTALLSLGPYQLVIYRFVRNPSEVKRLETQIIWDEYVQFPFNFPVKHRNQRWSLYIFTPDGCTVLRCAAKTLCKHHHLSWAYEEANGGRLYGAIFINVADNRNFSQYTAVLMDSMKTYYVYDLVLSSPAQRVALQGQIDVATIEDKVAFEFPVDATYYNPSSLDLRLKRPGNVMILCFWGVKCQKPLQWTPEEVSTGPRAVVRKVLPRERDAPQYTATLKSTQAARHLGLYDISVTKLGFEAQAVKRLLCLDIVDGLATFNLSTGWTLDRGTLDMYIFKGSQGTGFKCAMDGPCMYHSWWTMSRSREETVITVQLNVKGEKDVLDLNYYVHFWNVHATPKHRIYKLSVVNTAMREKNTEELNVNVENEQTALVRFNLTWARDLDPYAYLFSNGHPNGIQCRGDFWCQDSLYWQAEKTDFSYLVTIRLTKTPERQDFDNYSVFFWDQDRTTFRIYKLVVHKQYNQMTIPGSETNAIIRCTCVSEIDARITSISEINAGTRDDPSGTSGSDSSHYTFFITLGILSGLTILAVASAVSLLVLRAKRRANARKRRSVSQSLQRLKSLPVDIHYGGDILPAKGEQL